MKIRSLLTKTEWGALLLAALFLCILAAVVYRTMPAGRSDSYTITTRRPAEATPELLPPLDINTAAADELDGLEGIGLVLAERIVAYREENGPFETLEDLMHVRGIGEDTLERLREAITIKEEP